MNFETTQSSRVSGQEKNVRSRAVALLFGAAALLLAGWAGADPPSRVARLSYISGEVSFSPAGEDDWVEAGINRPLISGDRLWVERGSRAELQVGSAVFYLGAGTSVTLLNLNNRVAQLQVAQGTVNAQVRRLGPRDVVELATPNLAYSIRRPGGYRVDVDPRRDTTTVMTRKGEAEVYGDGASYRVNAGQTYRFYGNDLRDYDYLDARRDDEFDRWSSERNRRADNSVAARYVSRDVIGYEDLDEHGSWRRDAGYGNVWVPNRVPAGWAPYRDGHWSWVEPWGWTWVDDKPWGFAVSHYGRWANLDGTWGWVPGPAKAQPVYAPALVAFIGAIAGIASSNNNAGNVGWFPLAPREVYRPSYPVSRGYFNNVNTSNTTVNNTTVTNVYNTHVTNVTNVTKITDVTYVNQRVPGAVVAMPAAEFRQSRSAANSRVEVSRDVIAKAPVTQVAAVAPERASVQGGRDRGRKPPEQAQARPVVAKEQPPAAPVPFAAKERELAAQPGRPLDAAALAALKPAAPAPAAIVKVVTPPVQVAAPPPPKPPVAADAPRSEAGKGSRPADAERGRPSDEKKGAPPAEAEKGRPSDAKKATPPPEVEKGRPPEAEKGRPADARKGTPSSEAEKGRPSDARKDAQPADMQKGSPFEGRKGPQPAEAQKAAQPPEATKASPPVSVPRPPDPPKAPAPEERKAPPPEAQKAPQPPVSVTRPPDPPKASAPAPEERKAAPPPVNVPRPPDAPKAVAPEERKAAPPQVNVPRPPDAPKARPPEERKAQPPEERKATPPPVTVPRPPDPPKAPPPDAGKGLTDAQKAEALKKAPPPEAGKGLTDAQKAEALKKAPPLDAGKGLTDAQKAEVLKAENARRRERRGERKDDDEENRKK